VICATAAEVNEALELAMALGAEAGAEAAELDGDVEADELELLLQAARVAASARPSAGAIIRRATRLNRMTRLLCLGRMHG
jgi:DNA-binding GntR family transcriptional regulator